MRIRDRPAGFLYRSHSEFGNDVEAQLTIEPGMKMTSVGRESAIVVVIEVFRGRDPDQMSRDGNGSTSVRDPIEGYRLPKWCKQDKPTSICQQLG